MAWSLLMLANIYLHKEYPQLDTAFAIFAAIVGAITAFKLIKEPK